MSSSFLDVAPKSAALISGTLRGSSPILPSFLEMAAERNFLFSSESVNEGHPDKLSDQVRRGQKESGGTGEHGAAGASPKGGRWGMLYEHVGEGGGMW